jgi:hypothetical protein
MNLYSCYEFINRYYFGLLLIFLVYSSYSGRLRGRGSRNPFFLLLYRFIIFLFYWIPVYNFSSFLGTLYLFYLLLFLNLAEFKGTTLHLRNGFLDFIPTSLKSYFGCKLVKTVDIHEQCILALHPHGVLPYGTCVNIVTEVNEFSVLFPHLSNRVLVVASALMVIPFFRDFLLSYGIVDASRDNFESWLQRRHTVAVYVGGAHEALYATPSADILDLKRKTGFMKLSMKHGVPVVPCYTFNEVNHYRQIPYPTLLKFPLLSWVRTFVHSSTGLCLPLLVSFVPSPQSGVVTVVGQPLQPMNDKSLEENMERYFAALQELYDKHAPIYNSHKKELKILS